MSSPVLESAYGGLCAIRGITIIHMEEEKVGVLNMELQKLFAGNSIIPDQVYGSTDNYQWCKTLQ